RRFRGDAVPAADRLIASAARGALVATLLQIPVGMWVAAALAPAAREQVLGGDALSTISLLFSIVLALGLMHHLAAIAMGDTARKSVLRAAMLLALVTLLMSATLHRARSQAYETLRPAATVGQGSP